MNRTFSATASLFVIVFGLCSCAKDKSTESNLASKKQIEAWIALNHPEAVQSLLGCYTLEDEPGSGIDVGESYIHPYFSMTFTATTLDGTIVESTYEDINKQLGEYNSTYYYGPMIADRYSSSSESSSYNIPAGLEETIASMKVGGHRKVVIPGWLMSYSRYSSADDYYKNESGTHMIYDLKITEAIQDIYQYQIDSIESYMAHNLVQTDSLIYGLYYIQTVPPVDTTGYDTGVTVYVNYTGRLLNGRIFDTNNKDLAKINGIYNSSRTYEKMGVQTSESYKDYKIGATDSSDGSTMIEGFAYILSKMRKGEQGIVLFESSLGYEESGNGTSIPGYSPLRFDIEFLGKEEEE